MFADNVTTRLSANSSENDHLCRGDYVFALMILSVSLALCLYARSDHAIFTRPSKIMDLYNFVVDRAQNGPD